MVTFSDDSCDARPGPRESQASPVFPGYCAVAGVVVVVVVEDYCFLIIIIVVVPQPWPLFWPTILC